MDDAALVRVPERPRDFPHYPARDRRRERTRAPHALPQRLPVDKRHDEEHEIAMLFDQVNRNYVRVGELGGRARLTEEPFPHRRVAREVQWEELDGDRSIERDVTREEHDPHAAATDFPFERETAGHGTLKRQKLR